MHVRELWRYPVKSMAGEQLHTADVRLDGIPADRSFYVVDQDDEIVSARTRPLLLGLHATVDERGRLLVDGMQWDSQEIADAVQEAAGRGARIVPANGPERFDILPLLVATDGAIEAFGHDHRRLRPNLVVSGVSGLTEREWEGRQLAIGETVIALANLRARCIITTWDPDTVTQDITVLRHIRSSFAGTLALNAWAGRPGRISVGDPVHLLQTETEVGTPDLGRYA